MGLLIFIRENFSYLSGLSLSLNIWLSFSFGANLKEGNF